MAQNNPETPIVYVDGRGGASSGYGYFMPSTGESDYIEKSGLTNNQAEYMAILAALKRYAGDDRPLTILSDSQVVVSQINHDYAIRNDKLRDLARQVWVVMQKYEAATISWIPRKKNLAGKMLG